MTGFFRLGVDEVVLIEQARNPSLVPTAADALPTFAVYDGDGNILKTGTATAFDSGNLTGAYRVGFDMDVPGFERGGNYTVVVKYNVSSAARASTHTFQAT